MDGSIGGTGQSEPNKSRDEKETVDHWRDWRREITWRDEVRDLRLNRFVRSETLLYWGRSGSRTLSIEMMRREKVRLLFISGLQKDFPFQLSHSNEYQQIICMEKTMKLLAHCRPDEWSVTQPGLDDLGRDAVSRRVLYTVALWSGEKNWSPLEWLLIYSLKNPC